MIAHFVYVHGAFRHYLHFEYVELVEYTPQISHILGNARPDAMLCRLQIRGQLMFQMRQFLALQSSVLYVFNEVE